MPHSFTIPAYLLNPWFNTGEKEALENLLSRFKDDEVTPLIEYFEDLISDITVDAETVQDIVNTLLLDSVNITTTYDDSGNTLTLDVPNSRRYLAWTVVCGSKTTAFTTNTKVGRFVLPYAFTVVGVGADLGTTQTSGSVVTFDVNKNGTTILSTKITIQNGETKSIDSDIPPVISVTALSAGDEITFDIDVVGDGTAIWPQCWIYGYQT